jgi:plastocyanin
LVAIALVGSLLLMPTAGAQTEGQGVVVVPTAEIRAVDVFLIEDDYFEPKDAVVDPGTTLMWINRGQEQHTVTSDDGQFDSGVLEPGDTFLTTVEGSGTLTYHLGGATVLLILDNPLVTPWAKVGRAVPFASDGSFACL